MSLGGFYQIMPSILAYLFSFLLDLLCAWFGWYCVYVFPTMNLIGGGVPPLLLSSPLSPSIPALPPPFATDVSLMPDLACIQPQDSAPITSACGVHEVAVIIAFYATLVMLILVLHQLHVFQADGPRRKAKPLPRAHQPDLHRIAVRRENRQAHIAYMISIPILLSVALPRPFQFLVQMSIQSIYSARALMLPASRRTHDIEYHTRGYTAASQMLQHIIGHDPLEEQVNALRTMLDVADRPATMKPPFVLSQHPHSQLLSPSQHDLFSRVRKRRMGYADLIVMGNAGCSKTTMYLALASMFKVHVVVPSNELLADVTSRAAVLGVALEASTQHKVFDQDLSGAILLVDEVWLLPEWHVRAIFALAEKVIAFGDPYQTNDLGFGQTTQSRFTRDVSEKVVELPTSFTVPQDTMAYARLLRLIPGHYRTVSPVRQSMFVLTSNANISCPVITGSRECKAGMAHDEVRTIVTAQGARFESACAHVCGRDLTVLEAAGTFGTGNNRRPLMWTMISRHSFKLYLDLSPSFYNSFGVFDFPSAVNDENIEYILPPEFRAVVKVTAHAPGIHFDTFTPVKMHWQSPMTICVSNASTSIVVNVPYALCQFSDIMLIDSFSFPSTHRAIVSIVRV